MIVTDKEFYLDKDLVEKLDLMIARCVQHHFDNLVLIDGYEGYGKTSDSILMAYYMAWKTGRKFSVDNIFFDLDDMLNFAKTTSEQIIIWDEAALSGLASDWANKSQRKLIKLLMTARKKKHIYFFNIPKFYKLNEYIITRAIGLLHVYSEDELNLGPFTYYRKEVLEEMMHHWRVTRKSPYRIFSDFGQYGTLRGKFTTSTPQAVARIINVEEYERKKDEAIAKIGDDERSKKEIMFENKLLKLQYLLSKLQGLTQKNLAEQIDVSTDALLNWKDIPKKYPHILELIKKNKDSAKEN